MLSLTKGTRLLKFLRRNNEKAIFNSYICDIIKREILK